MKSSFDVRRTGSLYRTSHLFDASNSNYVNDRFKRTADYLVQLRRYLFGDRAVRTPQ